MPGGPALERAYRETTYRVLVSGEAPIDLHAGVRSVALDLLLARAGTRDWAFLTAWNPGSRVLPAWRNAQRQRRLLAVLGAGPRVVLPGAGIPASEDWEPEASVFVAHLPLPRALRLAAAFGQLAVLAGRRGRPAELTWAAPACASRLIR
jgi:hypothetical protein